MVKGYNPKFSVELASKRTENSKTFLNLDGSLTTVFYASGKPARKNATYYGVAGYCGRASSQNGTTGYTTSTDTEMIIGYDVGASRWHRVFLSFDTSGIPDNAAIISAYLRIYHEDDVNRGLRVDANAYGTLSSDDFQRAPESASIATIVGAAGRVWGNSTTFTNVSLTGYSQYGLRRADSEFDERGFLDNVGSANPPELHVTYAVLVAPINVTATRINDGQIDIAWTDQSTDEQGHKVERKADEEAGWTEKATVPSGTNSWSDTIVSANHRYKYRVRAYYGTNYSDYSSETAFVYTTPAAPTGCTASYVATDKSKCIWSDASSYESGFKVEQRTDGGAWTPYETVGAGVETSSTKTVGANHKIEWRVYAYIGALNSGYATDVTPIYTTPSPPTGCAIVEGTINVSWTDNSTYEDDFRVERELDGGGWSEVQTVAAEGEFWADPAYPSEAADKYQYRVRARIGALYSTYSTSNVLWIATHSKKLGFVSSQVSTVYGEEVLKLGLIGSFVVGPLGLSWTMNLGLIRSSHTSVITGVLTRKLGLVRSHISTITAAPVVRKLGLKRIHISAVGGLLTRKLGLIRSHISTITAAPVVRKLGLKRSHVSTISGVLTRKLGLVLIHISTISKYIVELRFYDRDDNLVKIISSKTKNFVLVDPPGLDFQWFRDGGCGPFSFGVSEDLGLEYNYKCEIYLWEILWYTGYITKLPDVVGTQILFNYAGWGYSEQIDWQTIKETYTGTEISAIAEDIVDNYIVPNTKVKKAA